MSFKPSKCNAKWWCCRTAPQFYSIPLFLWSSATLKEVDQIQQKAGKYSNTFQTETWILGTLAKETIGDISSELYGDWLWDENFKFCLIFTHFSRFSPFSGYIWWNNTLSSLENFSLNSILFFLFLMSHPDNGGFLKIAQKRDSISKKTSFCIMVINTDHQESWFLSVGHPLCALR